MRKTSVLDQERTNGQTIAQRMVAHVGQWLTVPAETANAQELILHLRNQHYLLSKKQPSPKIKAATLKWFDRFSLDLVDLYTFLQSHTEETEGGELFEEE